MILNLLTLGMLLAVAIYIARRIDRLQTQLTEVQQENGIEASITRRYCGKLLGDDIR
jgi:hypothetical protein